TEPELQLPRRFYPRSRKSPRGGGRDCRVRRVARSTGPVAGRAALRNRFAPRCDRDPVAPATPCPTAAGTGGKTRERAEPPRSADASGSRLRPTASATDRCASPLRSHVDGGHDGATGGEQADVGILENAARLRRQ